MRKGRPPLGPGRASEAPIGSRGRRKGASSPGRGSRRARGEILLRRLSPAIKPSPGRVSWPSPLKKKNPTAAFVPPWGAAIYRSAPRSTRLPSPGRQDPTGWLIRQVLLASLVALVGIEGAFMAPVRAAAFTCPDTTSADMRGTCSRARRPVFRGRRRHRKQAAWRAHGRSPPERHETCAHRRPSDRRRSSARRGRLPRSRTSRRWTGSGGSRSWSRAWPMCREIRDEVDVLVQTALAARSAGPG